MEKLSFHLWKRGKYWYYRKQGEKTFHSSNIPTTVSDTRAREQISKLIGEWRDRRETVGQFAENFFTDKCKWLEKRKGEISSSVVRQRRGHVKKYILPEYKHRRLVELSKTEIENWLLGLELSYQTKRHVLQTFRIIFDEAKDGNLIRENPLRGGKIHIGKRSVKHRDIFTLADYKKLFPEDTDNLIEVWGNLKYAALFAVLAYTGIRSGEARALRWKHYIPGEVLSVLKKEQAVKRDGFIGDTKTRIKIPQWLPTEAEEILLLWGEKSPGMDSEDLIFFGQDTKSPLNVTTVSKLLPPAIERAKIDIGGRNLVVHSFRHTAISRQLQHLSPQLVRELVGHKTEAMTVNYDGRDFEDRLKKLKQKRKLIQKIWQ
jgi:integrase